MLQQKQCYVCLKRKPLDEFHEDKSKKSGYRSNCKDCQNACSSQWFKENREKRGAYQRQYYAAHRDAIKERSRAWAERNREDVRARSQAWANSHRPLLRQQQRDNREKLRAETFAAYGAACNCCGEAENAFLSIDHINGGGSQHRREEIKGHNTYAWLKRNGWPVGFQVLCYNCNQAKHIYGECPHRMPR